MIPVEQLKMNITTYIDKAPCNITHMQLGMPQEYREQLIQESYRLKNRKDRENPSMFTHLFHEQKEDKVIGSGFDLWKDSNLYNTLLENILGAIQTFCPQNWTYGIANAWMGIYKEDQRTKSHKHEPCYKSFCYYISSEEPHTPMVFDELGIEIDAITDRLIIFPSNLLHSVPPCRNKERIMIAGNIIPLMDKQKMFTMQK
jgi:hypothetical protein